MTRKVQERVRKAAEAPAPVAAPPMDETAPASGAPPSGPILILHLRLRTKDMDDEAFNGSMQDQVLVYKPTFDEPEAYDRNPFAMAEALEQATASMQETPRESTVSTVSESCTAVTGVPLDGRPACWWCCHPFEGDAVSIPLESTSTPSYGYGVFCSFPCACAYLFGQEEMSFRRWERFSLLCSEYRKMGGRYQRIPQAPPRQTLKIFGGTLNIAEFRKLNQRDCAYRVVTPTLVNVQPTISVVPLHQMQMSTIQDVTTARTQNRSSADEFSNSGGLRLKRSKPILDGKTTLEHFIQGRKIAA